MIGVLLLFKILLSHLQLWPNLKISLLLRLALFQDSDGVLAQALFVAAAREELQRIQDVSCGDNDTSFYKRL